MAIVTDYYKKHLKSASDNKIVYPKTTISNVFLEYANESDPSANPMVDEDSNISDMLYSSLGQGALGQYVNFDDTLPTGNSFINKHGSFAGTWYPNGAYVLVPNEGWYKLDQSISRGALISAYGTRVYIGDEISTLSSDLANKAIGTITSRTTVLNNTTDSYTVPNDAWYRVFMSADASTAALNLNLGSNAAIALDANQYYQNVLPLKKGTVVSFQKVGASANPSVLLQLIS